MSRFSFELGQLHHAKAIFQMRLEAGADLTNKLGPGHWGGSSRLPSIRERLKLADSETLRHSTIYVACQNEEPVGSVVVSTFQPGFWKRSLWEEPRSIGLGVFNLVVFPRLQRRGIGRFLMEGVEGLAKGHQIRFVRLDAYAANPYSTTFYRSIGYTERGVIDVRTVGLVLFEKSIRNV